LSRKNDAFGMAHVPGDARRGPRGPETGFDHFLRHRREALGVCRVGELQGVFVHGASIPFDVDLANERRQTAAVCRSGQTSCGAAAILPR
jgi:hypothetical protein